jgi:AraC family transcriptional regulator of adaptative response/methylated-DNA-[protein]-cysteine methyltransferase
MPANDSDYARIEDAIKRIEARFPETANLEELAGAAGLSAPHFQRVFRRWAGISPKRFQQFLTVEYAKQRLASSQSVLHAAFDAGLSGPGRLHDLFVACEAMTPGEYKSQARGMAVSYGFHASPFGECLLLTTARGVCGLGFVAIAGDDGARRATLADLGAQWSLARLTHAPEVTAPVAARIFSTPDPATPLTLVLKGTNLQIKVWEALLRIPPGHLATYQDIAKGIGKPSAARAVGNAIAHNAISYLIPCHRVIRKSGAINHYRWGTARKQALIGWEQAHGARRADKAA